MIAKPPPPPPKHHRDLLAPKASVITSYCDLERYKMPMHSEYVPAWVEVLRRCGYPTNTLVLDFETYFDETYTMKDLSTVEYIVDPRFEVMGLAHLHIESTYPFADYEARTQMAIGDEDTERYVRVLQLIHGNDLGDVTVIFQNAPFDATVLARRYGVYPKYIVDTLSLARAWNSRQRHGLDKLTKQFGLIEKGDTNEFKGLSFRRRYMKPKGRGPKMPVPRPLITDEQVQKLSGYACNDVMRQWELFTILLPKQSNAKVELRLQQHTLELFTKPSICVDKEGGKALMTQLQAEVDSLLLEVDQTQEQISGNISFDGTLSGAIRESGENPQIYYKPMKKGYALAIAKDDPEREKLLNHPSERVRKLLAARIAVKSTPLHIARIQSILNQAIDGILPIALKYYGAHTGRWSGAEGINLQNLPKAIAALRELLMAPDGSTLIVVDAASIEARVLAWIAGQADLVFKFANNEEIYCGFAEKVLGYKVRKPKKEGSPGYIEAIESRHKWARNSIGKIGILGCGYGMGAFEPNTNKTKPNFMFAAAGLDAEMAEKIVTTYRDTNKEIVKFWSDLEKAFIYTRKYRRPCQLARGLRFDSTDDCDVVITLPNGRELHYLNVKLESDQYGREHASVWNDLEKSHEFIWGGTLAENIVQAISRDILAECFLRLEDQDLHTALHVHDEVVCVTPIDNGPAALKLAIKEMSTTPTWAPGLPLGAEGMLSQRYKK